MASPGDTPPRRRAVEVQVNRVASYDNTTVDQREFLLSTGGAAIGYSEAAGAPASPTSGSAPLARNGTTTTLDDGCAVQPAGRLTGKVALVRRGTCSLYQKSSNAQTAGAVGVILYNNTTGLFSPTVAGTPPITVPVIAISAADGAVIDAQIQAGQVSINWTPDEVNFPNPTGGLVSSFSSYGLAPDLALKPSYLVKIRLLKALGNTANPMDWETWTSPTVTLARP